MPLGSLKAIFVKVSEFYQISLKILPNLTDFSSQLMVCMYQYSFITLLSQILSFLNLYKCRKESAIFSI